MIYRNKLHLYESGRVEALFRLGDRHPYEGVDKDLPNKIHQRSHEEVPITYQQTGQDTDIG